MEGNGLADEDYDSDHERELRYEKEREKDSLLPHERLILEQKKKWTAAKAPDDQDETKKGEEGKGPNIFRRKRRERRASQTKRGMTDEEEETYLRTEWPRHEKHYLILSNVGRPIYSRYGDEQRLCSFMPILSTISNLVEHSGDTIRTIIAGQHQFVFLFKGPLFLVAISGTPEPAYHLYRQLEYLHSQVLSALTANVNKIYDQRAHFDMRSLLGNSTAFIDNLVDLLDNNPEFIASVVLNAVSCLKLDPALRASIGNVLHQNRTDETVYSLLVARRQLVSIVRLRRHTLHSADFHLILNFLSSTSSIHSASSSSTVPLCLPKFNDRGYLHVYVAFLAPEIALLLIATKPGNFDKEKEEIEKQLKSLNALEAIGKILAKNGDDYFIEKELEGGSAKQLHTGQTSRESSLGFQRLKSASMPDLGGATSPTPSTSTSSQSAIGRFSSNLLSSVNATAGALLLNSASNSSSDPSHDDDGPPYPLIDGKTDYLLPPIASTIVSSYSSLKTYPTTALSPPSSPHSPHATSTINGNNSTTTTTTTSPSTSKKKVIHYTSPLREAYSSSGGGGGSGGSATKLMLSPFAGKPASYRKMARRLLLHFIYKDRPTSQFTCPAQWEPPYNSLDQQKRLFRIYQYVHRRMMNGDIWMANNSDGSVTKQKALKKELKRDLSRQAHKILFFGGARENIVGWITRDFELYATFGPMVTKASCIHCCNQLLAWIKAEEPSLFIMNSPVW